MISNRRSAAAKVFSRLETTEISDCVEEKDAETMKDRIMTLDRSTLSYSAMLDAAKTIRMRAM